MLLTVCAIYLDIYTHTQEKLIARVDGDAIYSYFMEIIANWSYIKPTEIMMRNMVSPYAKIETQ